jgi:hypothetical protein
MFKFPKSQNNTFFPNQSGTGTIPKVEKKNTAREEV